MRFIYPQGKEKALTFSYDDGQIFDRKLVEIFNSHGLKGTFHLNSGQLEEKEGKTFVTKAEVASLYAGHEVACHGVEHRHSTLLNAQQLVREEEDDRMTLEQLTGGFVQGMSYAFGDYNQKVKEVLKTLGILYSRTVNSTGNFSVPADFLEWHPTCHHNNGVAEIGERFLHVPEYEELPLMYVWGHSFEFGNSNDFSVIEAFAEQMAGRKEIWYATNIEICRYIQAVRSLEYSADGHVAYNPSAVSVWIREKEEKREIKSGETVILRSTSL